MKLRIPRSLAAAGFAAALLSGCADAPTSPDLTAPAEPRLHSHWTVSITGPTVISSSGSHTYYANTNGSLVSPTFQWSVRTCPGTNVGSCTTPWTIWPSTSADYFTRYFSLNCSEGEKTFQIRVTAKGWFSPQVSDTHDTLLCPVVEN